MNALELPNAVLCPVCDVPLKRVLVAPVIDPSGNLEAVEATCPHCATSYRIGAEEMARALLSRVRGRFDNPLWG